MAQSFLLSPTRLTGRVHRVSFPKAVFLVRKSIDISE